MRAKEVGVNRDEAQQARKQMQRALHTASQLPPLWGLSAPRPCATCGEPAWAVKRIEGAEIPVCGPCSLKEMDDWEAQHGA